MSTAQYDTEKNVSKALTVAGDNQKFILIGKVVLLDVGVSSDNLVFGGQLGAFLEFEITNGTRQGEITVHATKVDKTTGRRDAVLFV